MANEKLSSYVFPCTRAHPVLNAVIPKKDMKHVPGSRIHYVLVHDVFFDESERGATLTRSLDGHDVFSDKSERGQRLSCSLNKIPCYPNKKHIPEVADPKKT